VYTAWIGGETLASIARREAISIKAAQTDLKHGREVGRGWVHQILNIGEAIAEQIDRRAVIILQAQRVYDALTTREVQRQITGGARDGEVQTIRVPVTTLDPKKAAAALSAIDRMSREEDRIEELMQLQSILNGGQGGDGGEVEQTETKATVIIDMRTVTSTRKKVEGKPGGVVIDGTAKTVTP
jgi:hypothetical protein